MFTTCIWLFHAMGNASKMPNLWISSINLKMIFGFIYYFQYVKPCCGHENHGVPFLFKAGASINILKL
jgi:hypothetical protein